MNLSPRAVLSTVLNAHVTPLLRRHGFDRSGRTYYRERAGGQQLVSFQAHSANSRQGGSFTVNLGLFFPELYDIVHGGPLRDPPQGHHCQVRYRIGQIAADGRVRTDHPRDEWWHFNHETDLAALGTPAAISEEIVRGRVHMNRLWFAVLATRAGNHALGQRIVDEHRDSHPRIRRDVARIAERMGLSFPGPVGEDELIVTFRPPPGLPLREKESLLWSIINELLPRAARGRAELLRPDEISGRLTVGRALLRPRCRRDPGRDSTTAGVFGAEVREHHHPGQPRQVAVAGTRWAATSPRGDDGTRRAAWVRAMNRYLVTNHALWVLWFDIDWSTGDYRLRDPAGVAAWRDFCS